MQCTVRRLRPEDVEALARIYSESILQLGLEHYSPEQVAAWASFSEDTERFHAWLNDAATLVAVDRRDECLGFGGLQPQGRVASLFVAPELKRRGIASRLLECLLVEARSLGFTEITTEASAFSRPLFEKYGFTVSNVEHTEFKGVSFTRYAMGAIIGQQPPGRLRGNASGP